MYESAKERHYSSMLNYLSEHQEVPREVRGWIKEQMRRPHNRFVLEEEESFPNSVGYERADIEEVTWRAAHPEDIGW